jgi:DUF1680 family protein
MRALLLVTSLAVAGCAAIPDSAAPRAPAEGPLTAVPFHEVEIDDAFWRPRIDVNRRVTVDTCLRRCEETGRIANFARCGGLEPGEHQGLLFNDSDVYKVIEGAAYTLRTSPDPALEARLDALIEKIAAAQREDGYLNTYYTMVEPAQRWKNIAHGHELYCAGHLIEAAIAYEQATGKGKLLDVARRFADHIERTFGPGRKLDPPGHPELELALVKLWRATGEARYLELAKFFVNQRGNPAGRERFGEYAQDHMPIREQREIVGHAVRAMYLYCAVADVAGITGDSGLWNALGAIWSDVVLTKMYVTGGIGSSASNEGITEPFDLPNESAYCETCAAIGMALWNQRMFLATGEARFADVVERELYNGFLSGVSAGGDLFFYSNPLASNGGRERVPWFDCSCCPTNVVRFLPSVGERIYAHRDDELYVSLYVGSRATVELASGRVEIRQRTEYPWSGDVVLHVAPERPMTFDLRLRVPEWCEGRFDVAAAGVDDPGRSELVGGFLSIRREWREGDTVLVRLDMTPRRVHADPRVAANVGRVAVMRGPAVYCAEGVDNDGSVHDLVLPPDARLIDGASAAKDAPAGPVSVVAAGSRVTQRRFERVATEPTRVRLAPYFAWANRGAGEMAVWLAEVPLAARSAGGFGQQVGELWLSASHVHSRDQLGAIADGVLPKSSADHDVPRHTFWNHLGTREWLQQETRAPRKLSSSRVYWFDDTGRGQCRVPESWSLSYRENGEWKPVELLPGESYGCGADRFQSVRFREVVTDAVRMDVASRESVSAGVLEWALE